MMLRDKIQDQIKDAMRAKDQVRLAALRFLWSEIKNAEIDAKVELADDAVVAVAGKEVKKRREAIEQMESAGRDVGEEKAKLAVIEEFMPEQMSKEKIGELVDQVVSGSSEKDFGKVMGQVMGRVKGKADGKLVGEVVREKLKV